MLNVIVWRDDRMNAFYLCPHLYLIVFRFGNVRARKKCCLVQQSKLQPSRVDNRNIANNLCAREPAFLPRFVHWFSVFALGLFMRAVSVSVWNRMPECALFIIIITIAVKNCTYKNDQWLNGSNELIFSMNFCVCVSVCVCFLFSLGSMSFFHSSIRIWFGPFHLGRVCSGYAHIQGDEW